MTLAEAIRVSKTLRCDRCGRFASEHHAVHWEPSVRFCLRCAARWLSFENFLADMGERPSGKSLDHIDNDGHCEPFELQMGDAEGAARQPAEDV